MTVYRRGEIVDGALDGDLILVASGDITMGGRDQPDGTLAYGNIDHTDANAVPGVATLTDTDPLTGLNALARQVADAGITSVRDLIDRRPTLEPDGEGRLRSLADHDQRQRG